ncbi:hypothetical protein DL93DRAFT_1474362 [Clavulina sp. PMI_390]|nr:hypothetical protein DL93DRAFT_1474362 [Clavulina sp. PMI_390]
MTTQMCNSLIAHFNGRCFCLVVPMSRRGAEQPSISDRVSPVFCAVKFGFWPSVFDCFFGIRACQHGSNKCMMQQSCNVYVCPFGESKRFFLCTPVTWINYHSVHFKLYFRGYIQRRVMRIRRHFTAWLPHFVRHRPFDACREAALEGLTALPDITRSMICFVHDLGNFSAHSSSSPILRSFS